MGPLGPARTAIVGLGPKGLYALERLLHHHALSPGQPTLEVVCFDPHPIPGAGPVYDPSQPDWLLMNFAAELVDMWVDVAPDRSARPDFVTWRAARDPAGVALRYPPRAQVGRYLNEGFESLLTALPGGVTVEVRRARVDRVRGADDGWEVRSESAGNPAAAAREFARFDEVLVTVGHQGGGSGALEATYTCPAPLAPAVFPVGEHLSPAAVPAGSVVAARGFALTFLDGALALTEGRGGSFEPVAGSEHRLRYEPGGAEIAVIYPFTRSGRPTLAKPDPEIARAIAGLDELIAGCCERIDALPARFRIHADLIPILVDGAAGALRLAGATSECGDTRFGVDAIRDAITALIKPSDPSEAAAEIAVAQLEASIEIGCRLRPPDHRWALGESWRAMYPAISARLGDGGIEAREWAEFQSLATEMERLSFGPPPINAAKLLALIDAGRVDLGLLAGGRLEAAAGETYLRTATRSERIDVVVDAVLPPPGARGLKSELLEDLLTSGEAREAAGRRGIEVCPDGRCITADGAVSRGLAVLGRPTEDWIIGNDTLSRTLHPHLDRWARGVARRMARDRSDPTGAVEVVQ